MSNYSDEMVPCPKCKEGCKANVVKKENENKGRPFIFCADCNKFEWLDLPFCKCGLRKFQAKSKATGRPFRACPDQCKGGFEWID